MGFCYLCLAAKTTDVHLVESTSKRLVGIKILLAVFTARFYHDTATVQDGLIEYTLLYLLHCEHFATALSIGDAIDYKISMGFKHRV